MLHGLPHDYTLRDGDLVTLDFAVAVDGWVADSAVSFVVGSAREEDLRLIDTTERALGAAIDSATVGNRIGDISAAVAAVAHGEGYSINTDFGGHGVGRTMHGDPHVPNDGRAGRGFPLRSGLVLALEPGSSRRPMNSSPTPMDGRCAALTAPAERTRSTPSRSTDEGPIILTDRSFLGVD